MRQVWSAAEDALIRDRYPHEPTVALAKRLQRSLSSVYQRAYSFGLKKSAAYLASPAACRLRRGDNRGGRSRFPKGHVPFNKGLRRPGWGPGRMKDTQFKAGERRGVAVRLWKPIGTERISKDGYLERKVNDDLPLQARWRAVHLVIWEAAYGPLSDGYAVVFRNGDKADIRIENLDCISRRDLMKRNSVHNYPKPLALTVQLLGALNRQLRRRGVDAKEQDQRSS